MNPDELQALLAQLLGYAQPPVPSSTLSSSAAALTPASVPVYPGAPGPSTVPPGTGTQAGVITGGGGLPGNQGAGGGHAPIQGGGGGTIHGGGHAEHPLRAVHARLLHLLLHGTKPITHRQHLTLRALRGNTALPGTKKYRQQQSGIIQGGGSGGGIIRGGAGGGTPQRQRRQRSFGPMG